MGNLCVRGGHRARPLVVLPDGSRFRLEEHAGVAELMMEAPGHVVARAKDAVRERRLRALGADELLRAGEVYLLVPVGKAGARLCDGAVEAICPLVFGKKGSKLKGRGGSRLSRRRIFPGAETGFGEDDVADGNKSGKQGLQVHRLRARQWRPALETIDEA
ncbi:uncharacterized protein LOC104582559 [Brachypodium distachyon]|uniref:Uncharacterized protein n=1 Tax=Brachypodium distachyon TaxID=15368 RepID=A0A0Q3FXC9_BRADI|nr:uncharacterized protein LOC104582559 [Brachypodium distachyon]KQK04095.1 hypothetical protein BRADI_2g11658v3 [Brachypodium distachyon]|eukprot:XP_010230828.1 uncharacterized protein LOC104582559 [Brachypodium distachyon]